MRRQLHIIFIGLLFCSNTFGQAMKKGEIALTAGMGIGIYKIFIDDTTDAGGATLFPFSAEYSIFDKLSVGVAYQRSNFITNSDSSSNTSESVKANFIGVKCDFHFLKSEKADLYLGFTTGYDNIVFKRINNSDQSFYLSGGGLGYHINTGLKLFFGNHIGMFFGFTYAGYAYNWQKSTIDGQDVPFPDFGNLKFRGGEGKIGLVGKF